MLLAVDIGNTNTVFGLFAGDELRLDWRAETRVERTGDEYAALLRGLFELSGHAASRRSRRGLYRPWSRRRPRPSSASSAAT